MKDCRTCKYGYEEERLGIPMCHHPKRFSEDCVDFNMHEEKEIKESEKPDNHEEHVPEIKETGTQGLDEAANVSAKMKYPYEGGMKGEICEYSIPIFVDGFKAGAEWAMKQK